MIGFLLLLLSAFFAVTTAVPSLGPRHTKGVQIKNKGLERLWVEMTNEDSFVLPAGQMASVILEENWTGKIFARSEECQFQKCTTPYSAAELSFGGDTKEDRYRVSLIEGFNQAIKIQPTGPTSFCKTSICNFNLAQDCPAAHQIKNESDIIISCSPIPGVFQNSCPQAVVDLEGNQTITCKTSDTYLVTIG